MNSTATIEAESESSLAMNDGNDDRVFTKGFVSLLGVSFFGAANDNILKQVLTYLVVLGGLWPHVLGEGTQAIVSLVLTIPFIFLSGYAGQFADKFSKRNVILWVKIAEIPIVLIAMGGLFFDNFYLSLFALFLLAIQSSFYGPAKFGAIPEVVDNRQLSQANGLINAFSNIAIIVGALVAGPLTDMYYPTIKESEVESQAALDPSTESGENSTENAVDEDQELDEIVLVRDESRKRQKLPIGLALLGVSVLGLVAALRMPKMKAINPQLKFSGDFLGPHVETFKDANRPLLVVMFSWSGFYMIGNFALLVLPDLRQPLGVSFAMMSYLVGILAVSIGVGSYTVGLLSGKTIRPYFSLVGAIGMTVCFAIWGIAPLSYGLLAFLVFLIGFFAGFYIVPLQSLLQFLSPSNERGRFFGTANALSFVFISGAGVVYLILVRVFEMTPERIPLVCAGLAAVGTMVGAVELNRITTAQKENEQDSST